MLAQTERATDILVLDDDSTDATQEIALRYAGKGVECLRGTWHNTLAAWNAGLRSTDAPLLVFLRAGELCPPEFLSHCQRALGDHPDIAIVSPAASPRPSAFDPVRFEQENTLADCSLVRRCALLEIGGWSHGNERDAIWTTWRRILAKGWKALMVPSAAVCPGFEAPLCHGTPHHDTNIDATLCLSLSGRAWMLPMTRAFLERQTYPHALTHLVIMDTSQNVTFGNTVQQWLLASDYGKHTYMPLSVGIKGLADLPRRTVKREVASACALIYNSFTPFCATPWVFFLEDDVLPPLDAYPQLLQHRGDNVVSVSALCMQRGGPHSIAWEWDEDGMPTKILTQHAGVTPVGGNGFCCVVIRGEYVRNAQFHSGPADLCHDHNFYRPLTYWNNLRALLDWSCVCRHYRNPREWTAPHHYTEHSTSVHTAIPALF